MLEKKSHLKRSIFGPFFLIFINDLSDDLVSNPKLFADDRSLFFGCPRYHFIDKELK